MEQERWSSDQEVLAQAIPRHGRQGLCVEQCHYFSNPMTGREVLTYLIMELFYSPCFSFCPSVNLLQNVFSFVPERENDLHVDWLWFLWTFAFVSWTWRPLLSSCVCVCVCGGELHRGDPPPPSGSTCNMVDALYCWKCKQDDCFYFVDKKIWTWWNTLDVNNRWMGNYYFNFNCINFVCRLQHNTLGHNNKHNRNTIKPNNLLYSILTHSRSTQI